ncbi:MAG: hypothetical protein LBN26_04425 [Christensenellaceae bacterium]|jgi:hypothetical protein|nr:hypothetical protein [Christensenellaceae bacterium]
MKNTQKALAALLILTLLWWGAPAAALAVGIQAGLPATIDIGTTSSTPTEIAFGGRVWQVIGQDGTGVYSSANTATLLLKGDQSMAVTPYNAADTNPEYSISTLKAVLDGQYTALAGSNAKEAALVNGRDIEGFSYDTQMVDYTDRVAGAPVTGVKYWPLSENEANALTSNVRSIGQKVWLRTLGYYWSVKTVEADGSIGDRFGNNARDNHNAARPAFNLDLRDVLLTSEAAASGKASAAVGNGLVAATAAAGAIKFTMQDADTGFLNLSVADTRPRTAMAGGTVRIAYTGAITGANQYVSCVLTDTVDNVLYYGKLATAASGTAGIAIPSDLPVGSYLIKIFNEQANEDTYTDFASAPVTIPLTVSASNGGGSNDSDWIGSAAALPLPIQPPKTGEDVRAAWLLCMAGSAAGAFAFRKKRQSAK